MRRQPRDVVARAPRPWRKETLQRQARFLAAYPLTGLVARAAAAAGVDRHVHYNWMAQPHRKPSYARRFGKLEAAVRAFEEAEANRIWAEFVARPR